ncbi:helix-turn-helix domain-containing protein [Kiloniella laminariae]|uniref:helix-turn-helix domain-containing protein n=1 Tax=Kiloniella laminariae TaxID=454162 RepID=UPI0003A07A96|nr:AraC family transcriptional regulator [Kiloniella laminariae]
MRPEELYVYKALVEVGAKSGRSADLGEGLSLSTWRNQKGFAVYERADHHSMSFYLEGGKDTRRHLGERCIGSGHPGAVCIMPAGVRSEWSIDASFRFMHLYFDCGWFDRTLAESCDVDPSGIELRDVSFRSDPVIEQICRKIIYPLDWQSAADQMALSQAGQLLAQHLLRHYTNRSLEPGLCRGGLSPYALRRVKEYVETSLDQGVTVSELARVSDLSPFHFTRMFRVSEGISPHQYVLQRRIEKAKYLLGDNKGSLSEIAQDCGFSSQSHMATRFRRATGLTPQNFRRLS